MGKNPETPGVEGQLQEYSAARLSHRLRRTFTAMLVALVIMLVTAALAISQRLNETHELELLHSYHNGLLTLDKDLYLLQRDTMRMLYTDGGDTSGTVLADNESIWLDFDWLLSNIEAEKHIDPSVSLTSQQPIMVKLRTGLLESLLKYREGNRTAAIQLYETGPHLHIEQLHHYLHLVIEETGHHIEKHGNDAATARVVLLGTYLSVLVGSLFLIRFTMLRLGETSEALEHDLEKALETVSKQQKLYTLGQVAGTISHELRNPLGTIRTSLYTLGMREENQSADAKKILERIERNIRRCDAIVASLLDTMREPQLAKETINLRDWTHTLLSEQEFTRDMELQTPDLDVGDVEFDSELLRRAALNVISNACQAMDESAREQPKEGIGILKVSLLSRPGRVGIAFRDNGAGIESGNLDRIFEPLYSTRSFGIGLGMLIVKQIMEQHAGSVEVSSQLGIGTQIILWLPVINPTGENQ